MAHNLDPGDFIQSKQQREGGFCQETSWPSHTRSYQSGVWTLSFLRTAYMDPGAVFEGVFLHSRGLGLFLSVFDPLRGRQPTPPPSSCIQKKFFLAWLGSFSSPVIQGPPRNARCCEAKSNSSPLGNSTSAPRLLLGAYPLGQWGLGLLVYAWDTFYLTSLPEAHWLVWDSWFRHTYL